MINSESNGCAKPGLLTLLKPFTGLLVLLSMLFMFSCSQENAKNRVLAQKILGDNTLDTVYSMAVKLLSTGFNAGDGYPQVWIRDFNTFINTACDVYDKQVIRENLLTFLRLQQPDYEIVDGYVLRGHVTWDDPNIYTSPADTGHVGFKNTVETDQETSLIQAIGKYIGKTGDRSILDEEIAGMTVRQRLAGAIDFLMKNRYSAKYGLLTGATTQDWGDVQVEGGAVVDIDERTHWTVDIYDNAMFVIALGYMIDFETDVALKQKWEQLREDTKNNIRKNLWDSHNGKFIPHIYLKDSPFPPDFDENKMWFHGGTAVAIEAGLLTPSEIKSSYLQMQENVRLSGAPSIGLTIYPPYPEGIVSGSDASKPYFYQDGGDWTWFGGRMVQQLVANGFAGEAYEAIRPMIDRVITNRKFYEWYARDGSPMGSGDFRGEAGVLAEAVVMLKKWAETNKR
jgi:GH15 family glucan-1,4-alpha-glucosidase